MVTSVREQVTTAFLMMSLIIQITAILLALVTHIGMDDQNNNVTKCCILSATFIFIAVACYGVLFDRTGISYEGYRIGYSFGIACTVGVMNIASAILICRGT
ncbi:uncharacterized protein LOC120329255 [Styela clava]|uniref:uncharacterized protein LOC120329255 n=1 Tax=Styela clava TaxID=7725 RepID=UPI00193A4B94|nr:uncharacterized protein LOC120329255 [Styela clava]